MTQNIRAGSAIWRPNKRFVVDLSSKDQITAYNDADDIAVYIDVGKGVTPNIYLAGSKSPSVCVWETRAPSGFVSKPRSSTDIMTLRFVSSGEIAYRTRKDPIHAAVDHATMMSFDNIVEVEALPATSVISATFTTKSLAATQQALTGGHDLIVPQLAAIAEMDRPGMSALYLSVKQVQRRIQDMDDPDDLLFPLVEELLCYQLLTAWPKQLGSRFPIKVDVEASNIARVVDYIQHNLQRRITLAEIARVMGVSVRTLQIRFKDETGQTPIQFIIDQRLARAHADLVSSQSAELSIQDIARRWGFVHMSDFGQRYKRLYGCTPRHTRSSRA